MIEKNIIAQIGHPILRKKTKEVNTNNLTSIKTKKIIKNLIKVMREVNGAGLAANQIYYDLRICVLEIKNNDRYKHLPVIPLKILINPKIEVLDKNKTFNSYEGCLSVPNIRGIVKRYCNIKVSYFNEIGHYCSENVNNFAAIVYQHEIDHLDGILFTDRVTDNKSLVTYDNFIKYYEEKYRKEVCKLGFNEL